MIQKELQCLCTVALAYKVGWLPFAAWIPKVYSAGENRLVAFLATRDASFITGQAISVSGGLVMA